MTAAAKPVMSLGTKVALGCGIGVVALGATAWIFKETSYRRAAATVAKATAGGYRFVGAIDAVVPAYNEVTTVRAVAKELVDSGLFGQVTVIDDGSSDRTAIEAAGVGAQVISLPQNIGKMGAMTIGVRRSSAEAIAFFDADALNLTQTHVRTLVEAFRSGKYGQVCGTIDSGLMNRSKIATGQRIVLRSVLEQVPCDCRGYTAETAINYVAERDSEASRSVELTGLRLRHKIDKFGTIEGSARNAKMVVEMGVAHVALEMSNGQTCDATRTVDAKTIGAVVGGALGGSVAGVPGAIGGSLAGRIVAGVVKKPAPPPACPWEETLALLDAPNEGSP